MVGPPGGGSASGGMDELLPLVIQLTKPEQVRYYFKSNDESVIDSFYWRRNILILIFLL